MSFHLIDQTIAKDMSQRIRSSPFALGSIGVLASCDLAKWLLAGGVHQASGLAFVGQGFLVVVAIAVTVSLVCHSRHTASGIWPLIALCSYAAGVVINQYVKERAWWILLVLIFFLLYIFLLVIKQRIVNKDSGSPAACHESQPN